MSKIIIKHNIDDDALAIRLVDSVIGMGRVSNRNTIYCYCTTFVVDENRFVVWCNTLKSGTAVFRVEFDMMHSTSE